MELNKNKKIVLMDFPQEKTELRFELVDWLKSKELSVDEAVKLLRLTANCIKSEAIEQAMSEKI